MNPTALAIAGPTASGKSAAALHLARALRGRVAVEIISVDSAQVYRGMDVGTAKPSAADRAEVPHHLIDILDPSAAYSAARFVDDARRLMAQIRARGALPLLVGGTMLYLRALREGIDALPPADAAVRSEIDARAALLGWPALHAELARIDPGTAARLEPRDAQRIQRALEVQRLTGQTLSQLHGRMPPPGAAEVALIALEPRVRAGLHERIERRFDAMLAGGLVDEVRRLRARGDLHPGLPAMRCVGYRQVWQALERDQPAALSEGLRQAGIAATRQLAKRQLTWLRSMHDRVVVDCDDADACAATVERHARALLDLS